MFVILWLFILVKLIKYFFFRKRNISILFLKYLINFIAFIPFNVTLIFNAPQKTKIVCPPFSNVQRKMKKPLLFFFFDGGNWQIKT